MFVRDIIRCKPAAHIYKMRHVTGLLRKGAHYPFWERAKAMLPRPARWFRNLGPFVPSSLLPR
jgi:hypothetical protein